MNLKTSKNCFVAVNNTVQITNKKKLVKSRRYNLKTSKNCFVAGRKIEISSNYHFSGKKNRQITVVINKTNHLTKFREILILINILAAKKKFVKSQHSFKKCHLSQSHRTNKS